MPLAYVYGEIGPDNLIRVPWLPDSERAAPVLSDTLHPGGAASNVAILLANWGVDLFLSGNGLGSDDMGRSMLSFLQQFPLINLKYLQSGSDFITPFCRIIIPPNGDRVVLFYNADRVVAQKLDPQMLAGCRLLILDNNIAFDRLHTIRAAHETITPILAGDIYELDDPVVKASRWIINSANLIRIKMPGVDLHSHLKSLQAASGALLITTDGPNPVQVIGPHGIEFSVLPPQVDVVDATGAGDTLKAAICYGLLKDWPIQECVRWGVAASSLAVQQEGACSNPIPVRNISDLARELTISLG